MTKYKGLIPAAGLGTRLYPLSLAVPKELLPIGIKPAIDYHVRDLMEAGIREVVVVTNRDKPRIRDYLVRVFPEVRFSFVFQDPPTGLGFALLLCEDFLEDDPFVMLLADNLFFGRPSLSVSLTEQFDRTGMSCIPLFKEGRFKPGAKVGMELKETENSFHRIVAVHPLHRLPSDRRLFFGPAAWLFTPEVFNYLHTEASEWDTFSGDYSERPAVEGMARVGRLATTWVDGDCFDIGTLKGYLDCVSFYHSRQDHF